MEPVFTLPYSEYAVANRLNDLFKTKEGYSLYVPVSRQEEGVDLLLTCRNEGTTTAAIQVKASRTYTPKPPKRESTERFLYYTWFNSFIPSSKADFFALIGLYPPDENRTRKSLSSWWAPVILLFTYNEMAEFLNNVRTKAGNPDKMFGFGFNDTSKIILTRGDQYRQGIEYTDYLLENRLQILKDFLNK